MADRNTISATAVQRVNDFALLGHHRAQIFCKANAAEGLAAGVCGPTAKDPKASDVQALARNSPPDVLRAAAQRETSAVIKAANRPAFRAAILELLQKNPQMLAAFQAMRRHGGTLTAERAADIITRRAYRGHDADAPVTHAIRTNVGEIASLGDPAHGATGTDERALATALTLAERGRTGQSAQQVMSRVDAAARNMGLGSRASSAVRQSVLDADDYEPSEFETLADEQPQQIMPQNFANDENRRTGTRLSQDGQSVVGTVGADLVAERGEMARTAHRRSLEVSQVNRVQVGRFDGLARPDGSGVHTRPLLRRNVV